MLKDMHLENQAFTWGMNYVDVHSMDEDGTRQYVRSPLGVHVRDPKTRDIDLRYERRLGRGVRWTGPIFYKQGIDAKNLPKDRPMVEDPNVPRMKTGLMGPH
jgi:hypothetical protein